MNRRLKVKVEHPEEKSSNENILFWGILLIIYTIVIIFSWKGSFSATVSAIETYVDNHSDNFGSFIIKCFYYSFYAGIPIVSISSIIDAIIQKRNFKAKNKNNGQFKNIIFAEHGVKVNHSECSESFFPYEDTSFSVKVYVSQYEDKGIIKTTFPKIELVFSSEKGTSPTIILATELPTIHYIARIIDRRFPFKGFDFKLEPESPDFAEAAADTNKMFKEYIDTGLITAFYKPKNRNKILANFFMGLGLIPVLFLIKSDITSDVPFIFILICIAFIITGTFFYKKGFKEEPPEKMPKKYHFE